MRLGSDRSHTLAFMPYAVILNTASVASTTGGTFADTLVANSGDSLQVGNYESGGARVFAAWGIDSAHKAELAWYYTRTGSTPDQTYGLRTQIPSTALGGAGTNAAFDILGEGPLINVFKSDSATMKVTSTASDAVVVSFLTEYDDLPGVSANFADWPSVQAAQVATAGYNCNPVASGTIGAYGAARAINADDTRWAADTYYAILGFSVETQVTTIAMRGYDWGSQLLGCPAGALYLNTRTWFKDLSIARGKPLIPILNSNNVGNTNLYAVDAAASTSPKVDIYCYELGYNPATTSTST
jgi:hypothetical protein